ncbi:MAG TPA: hypothetical protein VGX92_22520 [Pyrinomonadaceae bacterium]|jgi:hypothetical protein|nr:hypothetical protein [Pyrinomonadaceae bacterium]
MIEVEEDVSAARTGDLKSVCLSIAGIRIALSSPDAELNLSIDGATRLFMVEEARNPDARVSAAWSELDATPTGELLFDSGALWRLYRDEGSYLWHFRTPSLGNRPYKTARFKQDFTDGEVLLHRPYFADALSVYPLEYPLDELLLLGLLARGRGVELHSCGVRDDSGDGYLFVGQSGAGKTTMSRLWERRIGTEIPSDDRIVLRIVDGQLWMYGTPWHGEAELSSPISTPLRQIFFLRHGERNELLELSGVGAAARLFACSFPTYYDAAGLDFTLDFFERVTRAVPCRELTFIPDERVVDFVRRHST